MSVRDKRTISEVADARRRAAVAAVGLIPKPIETTDGAIFHVPGSSGKTYEVRFRQFFQYEMYCGEYEYDSSWTCTCPSRQRPCKHIRAVQERFRSVCDMDYAYASGDWEEMEIAEHDMANGQWVRGFVTADE